MELYGQVIDALETARRAHKLGDLTGSIVLRVNKDWDVLANFAEAPARIRGVLVPAKQAVAVYHQLAVGFLGAGCSNFASSSLASADDFSAALTAKTRELREAA